MGSDDRDFSFGDFRLIVKNVIDLWFIYFHPHSIYSHHFPFIVALFWTVTIMSVLVFTHFQIHTIAKLDLRWYLWKGCERAGNSSDILPQFNSPKLNWVTRGFQCGRCFRNGPVSHKFLHFKYFWYISFLLLSMRKMQLYYWDEINKNTHLMLLSFA